MSEITHPAILGGRIYRLAWPPLLRQTVERLMAPSGLSPRGRRARCLDALDYLDRADRFAEPIGDAQPARLGARDA